MTWKDDKNLGPWPFTPQPNKWGYLNNPRWHTPARAFVRGGPDDYDGREDEEPQVWANPDRMNIMGSGGQKIHNLCGHWHKPVVIPEPPEPPEPPVESFFIPWYSCPNFVVPLNDTGDVLYITTDNAGNTVEDEDGNPVSIVPDTLYILKYTASTQSWSTIYTEKYTGVDEDGYFASYNMWAEPPYILAQKGTLSVFGLYRGYEDYGNRMGVQLFIMDGDSILRQYVIHGRTDGDPGVMSITVGQGSRILIDNLDYIHVLVPGSYGGVYKLWDYISTDNGVTFNPVLITSGLSGTNPALFYIMQDDDNRIYVVYYGYAYKTSDDNGANWSSVGSGGPTLSKVVYVNGLFIGVENAAGVITIYSSEDFVSWTSRLVIDEDGPIPPQHLGYFLSGIGIAYDETYYYVSLNIRDKISGGFPLPNGESRIYRSNDLISWSIIATIHDITQMYPPAIGNTLPPYDLLYRYGKLYISYYYAEITDPLHPGVIFLTYLVSEDNGVTWTPIHSPFYDLSSGSAVPS